MRQLEIAATLEGGPGRAVVPAGRSIRGTVAVVRGGVSFRSPPSGTRAKTRKRIEAAAGVGRRPAR